LFAGSFGHTYGCHDIWQMYSAKKEGVNGPHLYWDKALDLTGANQMKYVRNLVEAFPITERVPDQSLIKENNYVPAERIQATRGKNYLMVYTSAGKPFTLTLGKISGSNLKGFWYDPKSGKQTAVEVTKNSGSKYFKPLTAGYGQDWVLVLYDSNLADVVVNRK
jgi:hypothetical protein